MDFAKIETDNFEELIELQKAYKAEIGECMPTNAELESLKKRLRMNRYIFMDVSVITPS